jgi:hypothetical protein
MKQIYNITVREAYFKTRIILLENKSKMTKEEYDEVRGLELRLKFSSRWDKEKHEKYSALRDKYKAYF